MDDNVLVYTTTSQLATVVPPVDDRPYTVCRLCGYERPIGTDCGLPCV